MSVVQPEPNGMLPAILCAATAIADDSPDEVWIHLVRPDRADGRFQSGLHVRLITEALVQLRGKS